MTFAGRVLPDVSYVNGWSRVYGGARSGRRERLGIRLLTRKNPGMDKAEYRERIVGILSAMYHGRTEEERRQLAEFHNAIDPTMVSFEVDCTPEGVQRFATMMEDRKIAEARAASAAGIDVVQWLLEYIVDETGVPATEVLQELALHFATEDDC